jgi:quinol monooxygenase YgiN
MFIIQVFIHVKSESVEAFKELSTENASNSVKEPGVVRFDLLQQIDDPTRFTLFEVYRNPDGHAAHRETAHYARWRDAVPEMMADARSAVKYQSIFPSDEAW